MEKISKIEKIITKEIGRNTQLLVKQSEGELLKAVETLSPQSKIAIVTGFFIPLEGEYKLETDGILGSVQMARAFNNAGVDNVILVDETCKSIFEPIAKRFDLSVHFVGLKQPIDETTQWLKERGFTHLLACERSGRAEDGRHYSMRGISVDGLYAPLDDLFFDKSFKRIAIGDGGNEIGMGNIDSETVSANINNGALIHAKTPCDHLIVAGVSNWGAFGLIKAWALHGGNEDLLKDLNVEFEKEILTYVNELGVIDGALGRVNWSVDGLDDLYFEALEQIESV